jgi:hypothetical protein
MGEEDWMVNQITKDVIAKALTLGIGDIYGEKFMMAVNDLYNQEINLRVVGPISIVVDVLIDNIKHAFGEDKESKEIVDEGASDADRIIEQALDEILDYNPNLSLSEDWLEEAERQKEAGVQLQLL